ncbi:MAG: RHS repeat-associated core domain-containing protein [Candidatus Micrarchaeota archaeon]
MKKKKKWSLKDTKIVFSIIFLIIALSIAFYAGKLPIGRAFGIFVGIPIAETINEAGSAGTSIAAPSQTPTYAATDQPQPQQIFSTTSTAISSTPDLSSFTKTSKANIFAGSRQIAEKTKIGPQPTILKYAHRDNLGSIAAYTDEAGILSGNMISFDSFGQSDEPSSKFTGKIRDGTGLYYFGARFYDPQIGRFSSADSMAGNAIRPQSLNRFTYTLNNPLKYVDPSGRSERIPFGAMEGDLPTNSPLRNQVLGGTPGTVNSPWVALAGAIHGITMPISLARGTLGPSSLAEEEDSESFAGGAILGVFATGAAMRMGLKMIPKSLNALLEGAKPLAEQGLQGTVYLKNGEIIKVRQGSGALTEAQYQAAAAQVGAAPQVLEAGATQGGSYLRMPYEGNSWLGHWRPLTQDEFADATNKLGALYRAGISHGDVSPQNMIITPSGRIKYIDFGFSKGASLESYGDDLRELEFWQGHMEKYGHNK